MSILDIFRNTKKTSANIAKDRLLQLRMDRSNPRISNLNLDKLQRALIEVIARYLLIQEDEISIEIERDDQSSIVELNVIMNMQNRLKHIPADQ